MKKIIFVFLLIGLLLFNAPSAFADLYEDGIAAYRSGNYDNAEYYFKEAIKIFPDNSRYRYYHAITLVQLGRIDEAEMEYNKVIQLAPGTEASDKAKKGLALINRAKNKLASSSNQPTAMASLLTSSPGKVVIPLSKNNNAIIVSNVVLNNKLRVNFILDTGATYTSISRQTAIQLGLDLANSNKVALKTANGIIQVPRVTIKSININGIEARDVDVTVHDLPAAQNVTGLLGLSFLEQFTVTIDKKNHRITLESAY